MNLVEIFVVNKQGALIHTVKCSINGVKVSPDSDCKPCSYYEGLKHREKLWALDKIKCSYEKC